MTGSSMHRVVKRLRSINMKANIGILAVCLIIAASCNGSSGDDHTSSGKKGSLSIKITAPSDITFEDGDYAGIYVVSHDSSGGGGLDTNGNYIDNREFEYSSEWTTRGYIDWPKSKSKATVYCYLPYDRLAHNSHRIELSTKPNQSSYANYRASCFLWGQALNLSSFEKPVNINVKHLMSRFVVKLEAGDGYTPDDLANAKVTICKMQTDYRVNLSEGEINGDGNECDITPYYNDGKFYAMLIPQQIDEGRVKVTLGNTTEVLKEIIWLKSGQQYQYTLTVSKSTEGMNIDITDWTVDPIDYGGVLE